MRAWVARLPAPVIAGVPIALAVLIGVGIVWAVSRPQPAAVRPVPAPSPTEVLSPSPLETPSPSPEPSPSPSPTATSVPTSAPTKAPLPPASCVNPAGGFPGTRVSANTPLALAWSPDGRLFWAERGGTIRVWQNGAARAFATVAVSTAGERGLLGLAISGSYVFAFFSNADGTHQEIDRWTDCGGIAQARTVIASGLPAGGDCCHKGGRLAINPVDGRIFATIGDTHQAASAQDPNSLLGKVVRFNQDGSGRMVWTMGLRNPFGIAFAPDGTLAVTNNGPSGDAGTPCGSCGDEFYLVGRSSGVDYQWPYCWGYSNPISPNTNCHGLPGPDFSTEGGPKPKSNPYFVAPTGVGWTGSNFVFCANSNGHMYKYLSPGVVTDTGLTGCVFDVKLGPDGHLYSADSGAVVRH